MLYSWWQKLRSQQSSNIRLAGRAGHRAHRKIVRLALEALEDRTLLSTLHVTNLLDDGSTGSLRQVIASATSGDTIDFPGLTGTLTQNPLNVPSEFLIPKDLTFNGPGANVLTVSGGPSFGSIFEIASGATVTLSGLKIVNGINWSGGGGAIRNEGNLTIYSCLLANNVSRGGDGGSTFDGGGGGGAGGGGGIFNRGTLTLTNSTLSGNQAVGGGGGFAPDFNKGSGAGGGGFGGGLFNQGGTVSIIDTTFSGNCAIGGNAFPYFSPFVYFRGGNGFGNASGGANATETADAVPGGFGGGGGGGTVSSLGQPGAGAVGAGGPATSPSLAVLAASAVRAASAVVEAAVAFPPHPTVSGPLEGSAEAQERLKVVSTEIRVGAAGPSAAPSSTTAAV
jgi:hypothetical protein